jgi:DNA-directed RNA polymerase sigma subunit (sigma70/sigma32)
MREFKSCLEACKTLETSCPNQECRNWINYEKELNCVLVSVEKAQENNSELTLRDVAERIGCSFVRVKQLEEQAIKKLNKIKNSHF